MNDDILSLQRQDIRKLLSAGSGDAALLWLYLQAGGQPQEAAARLQIPAARIDTAAALLRQIGLIAEKHRYLEAAERPVYTETDLLAEEKKGPGFAKLRDEVARRLGRMLSVEDLKILLGMRNYLELPDEVISILISFCMERGRARGNVKAPSMRSMEKEAYQWADNGIDTMEEAIAYVKQQMDRQNRLGAIRHALQIHDRRLTVTEEKYICDWLEQGFGEAEIALAYDRSCLNTGGLKWNYMNAILDSWKQQGLFTVEEINRGDRAPQKRGTQAAQPAADKSGEPIDPFILKALERRRSRKEND